MSLASTYSKCVVGHLRALRCLANWCIGGLFGLLLGTSVLVHNAEAAELSKEDKACLSCHAKEGESKTLESGEVMSLTISEAAYLASMHNETSCADCHAKIDAKTHGKVKTVIKSKHDYTLSRQETCRDCHTKKYTQYDDSVHAALVKAGDTKAPLCSDCHNPHTLVSVKTTGPIESTPCASCHTAIFKAYASDVHGKARIAKGKSAPTCADCHRAHEVKAASLGNGIKDSCLTCHENAIEAHKEWLPNVGRHFEAISCAACHAPDAQRRVNLQLFDGTKNRQMAEKAGVPQFARLTDGADTQDVGLDERALWSLLKDFNQDGGDRKVVLRGRLEVKSGVQAHQLSDKARAIKDCNFCHQKGATPFQSVTLSIAGPDGRAMRHGVQKEVLSSLTSMESVRGFYAIGGTRIKLLDVLLVMVVVGAMCVPIGHMAVKRMFKGVREKILAERQAVREGTNEPSLPPRGENEHKQGVNGENS